MAKEMKQKKEIKKLKKSADAKQDAKMIKSKVKSDCLK